VGLISLIGGYVTYTITVSIPRVPAAERWLSYLLLAAEGGGLMLIMVFSFYGLDTATRRRWARSPATRPWDASFQPKVAFEVPVFNESLELVQQTVVHLLRQDYPRDRFVVLVCDDSTDRALRSALEAFCTSVGAVYVQREGRRGFKAGALNHATGLLPPDVEFV